MLPFAQSTGFSIWTSTSDSPHWLSATCYRFFTDAAKAKPFEHHNIAGLFDGAKRKCPQPSGHCRILKVCEKCAGDADAAKFGLNGQPPKMKPIGFNREEHSSDDPTIALRDNTI